MTTAMTSVPNGSERAAVNKGHSSMALRLDGTSVQARRYAAAILEVLAGLRTPAQAAGELSLSLPAYYKLESRALSALLAGCDKPLWVRQSSANHELAKLQKHCRRMEQDLHRYQALARAAGKAAGLSAGDRRDKPDAKGRRKRRPSVRAIKAVRSLRQATPADPPAAPAGPNPPIEKGAT